MPPTNNQYFLNPSAGFTPSQGLSAKPSVESAQVGGNLPMRQAPGPVQQQPFSTGQPYSNQNPNYGTAVRPTDQSNNPQAAWLQNMATFAGGQLAGSSALGNQQGPVRRLIDVLGQQPFGEQNPMTLLMQALQQGNYGVPLPDQTQTPTPPIYRPPQYSNPVWGGPVRPIGFNPMQMIPS